jgi:GAF domain-containing protein
LIPSTHQLFIPCCILRRVTPPPPFFLSGATHLHHVLEDGVQHARELMHADRGSIFIVDATKKVMWTEVAENMGHKIIVPLGKGLVGACYNDKKTINVTNAKTDKRFDSSIDKKSGYGTQSVLCVPIMDGDGNVMAVAQMINKMPLGKAFDEDDIHLFDDFAIHISLAMSRVHFRETHSSTSSVSPPALLKSNRKRRREEEVEEVEEGEEEEEEEETSSKRGGSLAQARRKRSKREVVEEEEEEEEESVAGGGGWNVTSFFSGWFHYLKNSGRYN